MASTHININNYRTEIGGEVVGNEYRFPPVISTSKSGKKLIWTIKVRLLLAGTDPRTENQADFLPIEDSYYNGKPITFAGKPVVAVIRVDSRLGVGGKVRPDTPTVITKGLNSGKVNERNVFTQALRDALGRRNKQLKKVTRPGADRKPPMLASIDAPTAEPIIYPVLVQRKYDGVRAVTMLEYTDAAEDQAPAPRIVMYSRKLHDYPAFDYIKAELFGPLQELYSAGTRLYIDGEIYKHGTPLQVISGISRRADQPEDVKFDYIIYDAFIPDAPDLVFQARYKILEDMFKRHQFQYCKLAETVISTSPEVTSRLMATYLAEKYEGAMIRVNAPYVYSYNDYRSPALIKLKPAYDGEFELTGYTSGRKGKAAKALMLNCITDAGKPFAVTPALPLEERCDLFTRMGQVEANGKTHFENQWRGKKIIVVYDDLSKDGIPQRARTKMEIRTWD